MSKKSRRNRAKHQASGKKFNKEKVAPVETSKSSVEPKVPVSTVSHRAYLSQPHQYQYVISELRSIGLISGALAIILIVLTFILG